MERDFTVRTATGASYPCGKEETVLAAALAAGLGFPNECLSGGCGACRFVLVEGETGDLWPEAPGLSPRDRGKGNRRLGCQTVPRSDLAIDVTLDPKYAPPLPVIHERGVVAALRPLCHDMVLLEVQTGPPASFMPGQFALLRLPSKADAPRAYSMAGLPNDHGVWTFCIKRVPHGRFTSALFDRVRPGDAVALNGPFGHAYLRADSCRDLLCIAGGSGLAPIASIARGALASDEPVRRVSVFYGCRTAADVVEPGDIGLDDRGGGRLEFTVAISEAGDAGWTGARGPIHEVAAGLLGDALALCDVYVAGPSPMVQATLRLLLDRGVPRAQIYYDSFY